MGDGLLVLLRNFLLFLPLPILLKLPPSSLSSLSHLPYPSRTPPVPAFSRIPIPLFHEYYARVLTSCNTTPYAYVYFKS